jgi:nucleoid-associated protein YgaU
MTHAPTAGVELLQRFRSVLETAEHDPLTDLYNAAIESAKDSRFDEATQQLHVLLALDPDDSEARLLLARVLVSRQRWREALGELDVAAAGGARVPAQLREGVLRHLRAEETAAAAAPAEASGELARIKAELRALRADNTALIARSAAFESAASRWAWVAAGTSAVASLILLQRLLVGGATEAPPAAVVSTAADVPVVTAEAAEPAAPVRDTELADAALDAIRAAGVDASALEVLVRDDDAEVTGKVLTAADLKATAAAVAGLPGIATVGTDNVVIRARTEGALHTVVSGNTLSGISVRYYGTDSLYPKIEAANADLLGPSGRLQLGMQLRIPPVD